MQFPVLSAKILSVAALLSLTAVQAVATPEQFRFCSMDVDFPPYAKVDGTGHVQYLIVQAAKKMNVGFDRHVAPRRRCLEEIRTGSSDGMIAAFAQDRAEIAVFPMAGGVPDESKALAVVRYLVFRRAGARVDWDGQRFTGQEDVLVGVESGFAYVIGKLKQLGIRHDDGAKSLEQNLEKLALGRVDAVVAMDIEANKLITDRYAGRIEPLAKSFDESALFLMVSKQFYVRYPQFTEAYWQAIKEYRGTADYRQYRLRNP
jgi:polar amino acid transport system substrate-binding protein